MSLKRFRFLLRCLRFDDMGDRIQRREIDKLAPIRELFELFVENCKKCFSPSEYVTIDEQLVKFRGRCPFRVYLPNKPAKYGIKIFALVDAKMMYMWNMEVYCAKQPVGSYNISNSPSDVVMRLMNPILGSGRNLTTDIWYTSIPLAENLLKNKITLVVIFQQQFSKNRELNSTIFGFQKDLTLISYKPKPNKIVILLSSMHHYAAIDESTTDARKPEIITFYNSTKGAVDTVDEMCGSYDAGRNNRRWPLTIFFHLINTAGINSEILYHCDQLTSNALKRRVYLRNLAMSLIKPQVLKRAAMQNLLKTIRHKAARISGIPFVETEQNLPKKTGSNGRCALCPRSEDKRTRNFCVKCNHWVCGKHYSKVCSSCMDSSRCFMRNDLPMKSWVNACGVLNLNDSTQNGSHWNAWKKMKNKIIYFDSFGINPPPKELVNYLGKHNLWYTDRKFQDYNDPPICGHLCLEFIDNYKKFI
ncbi:hypothetical protein AGLY_002909 [Aphis glycines]|uniref:PiggyBac transposable element-derived protein domain-containing protein n=1 Tax=Aphis glycines TaxID=307491 RepID=A0A6G0U1K5_APHGL|nr:hypothetical protein AGLY_002909 [Aphis glycines]